MEVEISICIPAFNNVGTLIKCIDSILIQTFTNYEIIITDDSTSLDIQDYVLTLKDCRIKYFKNNVKLGSPENWNEAIRKSSAELIKLMHHDDCFADKESLQLFYNEMLDKKVSIAFGTSVNYDIISQQIINLNKASIQIAERINHNPFILLCANLIGSPSAMIFRKRDLIFDNKLVWLVDIDFYISMLKDGSELRHCEEASVIIGISENQITKSVQDDQAINIFEYFYILHKNKIRKVFNTIYTKPTTDLIRKFQIKNIHQIKFYFQGELPIDISRYFTFRYRIKNYFLSKVR
jgi:glycosyltransferase involved in cell wall biosynthesis